MKTYSKLTLLSFFERLTFAVGRIIFTLAVISYFGYELNGQFSAFWSLIAIVSTFFLFGLDTTLITYSKNENTNFGYLGRNQIDLIILIFLCMGSFISGVISYLIFFRYENIVDLSLYYFIFASSGFISLNIIGNLFKGYKKFNYLIFINLISFSLTTIFLFINQDKGEASLFDGWMLFSSLILMLSIILYVKLRPQIPKYGSNTKNIYKESIQKYIYRLAYQLAIRIDILIVYNIANKTLAGYYVTARLAGDAIGYLHQGFYPILVSKVGVSNKNEFKFEKLFLFLIGFLGYVLVSFLKPFLTNFYSEELITLIAYTVFASSIFNIIIFKSAEIIGNNKTKLSVLYLSLNIILVLIFFYLLDVNFGLKYLSAQILSLFIFFIIEKRFIKNSI